MYNSLVLLLLTMNICFICMHLNSQNIVGEIICIYYLILFAFVQMIFYTYIKHAACRRIHEIDISQGKDFKYLFQDVHCISCFFKLVSKDV